MRREGRSMDWDAEFTLFVRESADALYGLRGCWSANALRHTGNRPAAMGAAPVVEPRHTVRLRHADVVPSDYRDVLPASPVRGGHLPDTDAHRRDRITVDTLRRPLGTGHHQRRTRRHPDGRHRPPNTRRRLTRIPDFFWHNNQF